MTVREYLHKNLVDRLVWPDDANLIIDQFIASPSGEAMQGRWNDSIEGYPPGLLVALCLDLNKQALAWIGSMKAYAASAQIMLRANGGVGYPE